MRKESKNYSMKKLIVSIWNFYRDGFKNMTWGKSLWLLIILKAVILFLVLRMFFFKPVMAGKTDEQKSEYVGTQLELRTKNFFSIFVMRSSYRVRTNLRVTALNIQWLSIAAHLGIRWAFCLYINFCFNNAIFPIFV